MGRASPLDRSPTCTNRQRLRLSNFPSLIDECREGVEVPAETGSTGVPNVLVVEDEMVLRMRAVDIVEDAGFTPVEAVNADEAIAILESRSDVDLLFKDINVAGRWAGL